MINVRIQTDSDSDSVKSIIGATTKELRDIYRPIKNQTQSEVEEPVCIVAVIEENIIGTAEYLINRSHVLIRNLAVSPDHRRQGAARAIIEHIILKAKNTGKTKLLLSTIKETGNINIFLHMGFNIDSALISENFEGVHGEQITQVNMSQLI